MYVTCVLQKPYHLKWSVQAIGADDEEALAKAEILHAKIDETEAFIGKNIPVPLPIEQRAEGGYYRSVIAMDSSGDGIQVEYRKTSHERLGWLITDINLIDERGFERCNPAKTLDSLSKPVKVAPSDYGVTLKPGEELYLWNNTGFLCGGTGLAIVSEGMVRRSKGLTLS